MAATVVKTRTNALSSEAYHTPHLLNQPFNSNGSQQSSRNIISGKVTPSKRQQYTFLDASLPGRPRTPSMPMSNGSQSSLLAALPSFASVFGDGSDNQNIKEVGDLSKQTPSGTTNIHSAPNKSNSTFKRPNSAHHFFSPALRRDSASTFESVESSPTTTISTIESSLTEPSPSSSPESPNSILPSSPPKPHRTNSTPVTSASMELRDQFSNSFPHLPGAHGSESPNKKMRNTKNLSVNTLALNRPTSQLSKVSLSDNQSTRASSAPPTPAFVVPPPKVPRKKPSNLGLSIATPDSSSSSNRDRPVLVPQTPSDPQIRTLRALQTITNAPLFSPTHAPEGGMRLPPVNNAPLATRYGPASRPPLSISPPSSFDAAVSSPITKQTLDHVQEETDYELPLSQEAKSPSYPQGPICIYDPYVYLYLEPTDVEASEFDVVLNVAREVKNPFEIAASETQGVHLAGREGTDQPRTAAPEQSPKSTFQTRTDTTANMAPSTWNATRPQPEYIHVPWDHNTNVVDDLLRLCELIDDRVRQEKRVLVHCQCGVSRSASLVVAYGLYKNPQHTVQEAYDAVKNRSRWIGPNMNLIYQLSEFKTKLGRLASTGTHGWPSWRAMGPPRPNTGSSLIPELPAVLSRAVPKKSSSAPSQMERTNSFNSLGPNPLAAKSSGGDVTPGPSSAPPGMAWSPKTHTVDSFPIGREEPKSYLLPSLMDIDTNISLSPLAVEADAIEQMETPPAGAIANDLQVVARDLEDKPVSTTAPAKTMVDKGIQVPATIPPPPADQDSHSSDASTPRCSASNPPALALPSEIHPLRPQPSLPAGFSSLLSRRQNNHQLPIRQEPPHLTTSTTPIPQPFIPVMKSIDVPPTPSLLSPRAAEFTASPFHRTLAGDLAGSSMFEQQALMSPRAVTEDPRSPHQVGEAPITRNIFDMLGDDRTPR